MLADILFPQDCELEIVQIIPNDRGITIQIFCQTKSAICPECLQKSTRPHSHYHRFPDDLPCIGLPVSLQIRVRRFFCDNIGCPKRTFAERFPKLLTPYARQTARLISTLTQIAFEVSAECGTRLSSWCSMVRSPDSFLRFVRKTPEPPVTTPRILGVDDWAKRKGHNYGTILVDLETRRVVDVLSERTASAFADWLQEHPGVEVISRDRGKEYIKGATIGAPDAKQVADRWHLLKNLREALVRYIETMPLCLSEAAKEPKPIETVQPEKVPTIEQGSSKPLSTTVSVQIKNAELPSEKSAPILTKLEVQKQTRHARKQQRYEQIRNLHHEGFSINEIERIMGTSYRTVVKYLKADECPFYPEGVKRASKLAPYLDYLENQWNAGHHNATQLWREICQEGFKGSRNLVSQWAAKKRPYLPEVSNTKKANQSSPRTKPLVPWSVRRVTWLMFREKTDLESEEIGRLSQVLQVEPDVAKVYNFVHTFQRMVRNKQPEKLKPWLVNVRESGIEAFVSFAKGIVKDFEAVENALSMPWSNGQTEGQVNRLKFIKRQMYGRANFDLLRRRVLGYQSVTPSAFT